MRSTLYHSRHVVLHTRPSEAAVQDGNDSCISEFFDEVDEAEYFLIHEPARLACKGSHRHPSEDH